MEISLAVNNTLQKSVIDSSLIKEKRIRYIIWDDEFLLKPDIVYKVESFDYYKNVQNNDVIFLNGLLKLQKSEYSKIDLDIIHTIINSLDNPNKLEKHIVLNNNLGLSQLTIPKIFTYREILNVFENHDKDRHFKYRLHRVLKKMWVKKDCSKFGDGLAHGKGSWVRANLIGVRYSFDFLNDDTSILYKKIRNI